MAERDDAEREPPEFPLACDSCNHSPAVSLVVIEVPGKGRKKVLYCAACAAAAERHASRLCWVTWQYSLHLVTKGPEAGRDV